MNPAVRIILLASGVFLLTGMIAGVMKYRRMMTSETQCLFLRPAYRDED